MKTINSALRRVSPDTFGFASARVPGPARLPKAIAEAKHIARKRDRARLKTWVAQEVTQLHCDVAAEKQERALGERMLAYQNLIERVTDSSRKHTTRAKVESDPFHTFWTGVEQRVQISINQANAGGQQEIAVLASCAC
jgi:phenylpyruvate tautomerase PptA (4-oxalocrotonate tautomerase family)